MPAPIPADEDVRLKSLADYEILDTLPESAFDDLVKLAAELCDVPIALMSLIDANRQWFKAAVGLEAKETPRSVAFCAHAILQDDLFTVRDAESDPRFAENPLVLGDPHMRFYAGAPIQVRATGSAIGTLCVIDRVPRTLTDLQKHALRVLGNQVQAQLELRRNLRDLARERDNVLLLREEADELRAFVLHDLKNVLAVVVPNAEYVLENKSLDESETGALVDVRAGAIRMKDMLAELLNSGSMKTGRLVLRVADLDVNALVNEVERTVRRRVENAGQRLVVRRAPENPVIQGDQALLRRVLENLIDNALKYGCRADGTFTISVQRAERVVITVSDEGPGIPVADRARVFERSARLERGGRQGGYGIGLTFCKAAVDAHGGAIRVEDHAPSGASFVIELPFRS